MTYYTPDQEPATERLLLIQRQETSHGFGHIIAYVVRRAASHSRTPSGSLVYADDANATGYRVATWSSSKENAMFLDSFRLHSQLTTDPSNTSDRERKPYGVRATFREVYECDRKTTLRMADTYKKLDKANAKISATFGDPSEDDFAAQLIRLAACLGIKKFVCHRKDYMVRGASLAQENCFQEFTVGDVGYHVDRLIESYFPKQEA